MVTLLMIVMKNCSWLPLKITSLDRNNMEPPPMLVHTSAGTWIKKAWLSYSLYSQQVLRHRWIWRIAYRQERVQARKSHPDFEIQGRSHQKSKTGVSVKPRADVTRSPKQGYQWSHKKDLCPPICFFKNHLVSTVKYCSFKLQVTVMHRVPSKNNNLALLESDWTMKSSHQNFNCSIMCT